MIKQRLQHLNKLIPILAHQEFNGEQAMTISREHLGFSIEFLKSHIGCQFNLLSCISGVDFLSKKYRFSIVYDLLSLNFNTRLRVKVLINEITSVSTITDIFINANWWEREIWDLYGVYFDKHPDLRRILTDYGFEGHPLRKDFPLSGFVEVRYDEEKKRIVVEPLELSQEFRSFTFETPW